MTQAATPASADPAATPQKGMQRILDRQVKCIVERIRTDTNRQLLVLDFLDGLDAQERGEKSQRRRAAKDDPGSEEDDEIASDEPGFDIEAGAVLSKHMMKYAGWRKILCLEVLSYCEPRIFAPTRRARIDSATHAKRFMEFGFCLNVLNESSSDRPMTKNKRECFDRLRQVYIKLGRRFRSLTFKAGRNFDVDWTSQGVYTIAESKVAGTTTVELTDKFTDKTVTLPIEWLEGCPPGFFENEKIKENWSTQRASITLPSGEELECYSLFPKLKRTLARKLSDEYMVAAPVTPTAADDESSKPPVKKPRRMAASRAVAKSAAMKGDTEMKEEVKEPIAQNDVTKPTAKEEEEIAEPIAKEEVMEPLAEPSQVKPEDAEVPPPPEEVVNAAASCLPPAFETKEAADSDNDEETKPED